MRKKFTVVFPSDEELDKISDEELDEQLIQLEEAGTMGELLEMLAGYGITLIEDEGQFDDQLPGPYDTIH